MTPKSTVKASRPAWSALLSVVLVVGVLPLRFGVWHAEAQSDVSPRALSVALAVPQATFTVNTADDENTLCNAAGCSLREAIEAASAGDEIKFSTLFDSPQTIALQHGEIVIEKNLTITGPGANLLTVSGNNQSRVLRVSRNFTVNISGMTLAGGNGVSNTNPGLGGAILTQGNLTLTRLRINGNTGGNGGAIFNGAGGVLRVIESQISGNTATNRGGGISTNSNLTVLRSTLLNNTAQGGITGGGIDASGTLNVINSTISSNRVTNVIGPNGGGILVFGTNTAATIINSTITQNLISDASSAGGIQSSGGTTTIRNTIVAGNAPPPVQNNSSGRDGAAAVVAENFPNSPDVGGQFVSAPGGGNNLIGNVGTALGFTHNLNGDRIGGGASPLLDALLDSPKNNGGPTDTHAFISGSPAIDAGNNCVVDNSCTPALSEALTTDQRGFERSVGGKVDIGAYELGAAPSPSPSPTPPSCSFLVDPLTFDKIPAAGQKITVNVTTQTGCAWSANSELGSFIQGSGGGTESGSVTFTVDSHDGAARSGTVLVANQTVTINQLSGCEFDVSPLIFENVSPEKSIVNINVATGKGCGWNAKSNDAFIDGGGDFTGRGSVEFTVQANNGLARTGTMTVANRTITVNQLGSQSCSFVVEPLTFSFSVAGGKGSVIVNTQAGCGWTAVVTGRNFVRNVSPALGVGPGTVTFEVPPNEDFFDEEDISDDSGLPRQSELTIAGQVAKISQAGQASCRFTVSPTRFDVPATTQNISVNVQTEVGCSWGGLATGTNLFISGGGKRKGSSAVNFVVEANNGTARSGTLDVAGETVTVNQLGIAPESSVQFSANALNASEGASASNRSNSLIGDVFTPLAALTNTLAVTVTRTGNLNGPGTVDFATSPDASTVGCGISNGAASERCDFATTLGTLHFAPGEASKTFDVFITDDAYHEGTETFTIALTNPTGTGVILGNRNTITVTITDDDAATAATNPVDGSPFFVRHNYIDLLNREPDDQGHLFWTNEIATCGTDAGCLDHKREAVSAAFFLSIEFEGTGYKIIRMYKSTFTDSPQRPRGLPRYREFVRDAQEIGRGVRVGIGDWEQQLAANLLAFARAWVQRPEVLAQLPADMTAAQFVDKLFLNSEVTPAASERTAAITAFGAGGVEGRAAALISVVASRAVHNKQFNSAFVLMEYFGYLRRNPDDAPDGNFAGFDFWLRKLDSFSLPGEDMRDASAAFNRLRRAEMVRAFIISAEYRGRFGTP